MRGWGGPGGQGGDLKLFKVSGSRYTGTLQGHLDLRGLRFPHGRRGVKGTEVGPQIWARWNKAGGSGYPPPPSISSAVTDVPVTFIPCCHSNGMSILALPQPPCARTPQCPLCCPLECQSRGGDGVTGDTGAAGTVVRGFSGGFEGHL